MTRDDENSIHDGGTSTVRTRKRTDMKNRLQIMNNNPDALFISIHLNSFPQAKVSGAQVFYSPNNDESKIFAEMIQEFLIAELDPQNKRLAKRATNAIYLLDKAKSTAVLVEAGFLSNMDEAQMLSSDEYQSRIAWAIYVSVMKYLEREIYYAE